MGYLDATTITVDATLTKQGRRLLANGQALNINMFCLSDTGIDYNLWNVDHPSGSAFYGEAIENLPQTEALSQGEYFMRNRLLTLLRGTTALPILNLTTATFTVPDAGLDLHPELMVETWHVSTMNFPEADTYTVVCPNADYLVPRGQTWSDISGIPHQYISAADYPNPGMLTIKEDPITKRASIDFKPAVDNVGRYTSLWFFSDKTGAYATHSNLYVPPIARMVRVKE